MSPKPTKQSQASASTRSSALTSFYNRVAQTPSTSTPSPSPSSPQQHHHYKARDGLGAYLSDPASQAAAAGSRVVFWDEQFVAIRDLYPKSSVHCLLLARDPTLRRQHPFDAFGCATPASAALLDAARSAALRLRRLVAKELQRRFGPFSRLDAAREAALDGNGGAGVNNSDADGQQQQQLPPGRDWESEVLVGVHAHPSMNDLHVHVLSREMHSECLRHRRHYNSFHTPFLVPLDDLPLADADDPRRHPGREGYLTRRDLRCWRCGANFGNRFARLKEHLELEFDEWKRL